MIAPLGYHTALSNLKCQKKPKNKNKTPKLDFHSYPTPTKVRFPISVSDISSLPKKEIIPSSFPKFSPSATSVHLFLKQNLNIFALFHCLLSF